MLRVLLSLILAAGVGVGVAYAQDKENVEEIQTDGGREVQAIEQGRRRQVDAERIPGSQAGQETRPRRRSRGPTRATRVI